MPKLFLTTKNLLEMWLEIISICRLFVFIIAGIGTIIEAFKTSLLWGLGCLLVAPISLLFLVTNWDVAKNPFFLQLVGFGTMLLGSYA